MNVSLTRKLETLVKRKVKSGLYESPSEVVREALRLLDERDAVQALKLEALKKVLGVGLAELEAGKGKVVSIDSIKARARRSEGNRR